MSDHTRDARARADAQFEKMQTQARQREKLQAEREDRTHESDDKIARLKAQRLEKEAAERRK